MSVLGFVSAFDELGAPDRRIGRLVASHGMVAALLEHGRFDELHLFLPFARARRAFERVYGPPPARVKLLELADLPRALDAHDYTALHAAEHDRYFVELCHLRGRRPVPVTCVPHTLCYWPTQVHNLYKVLPGAGPTDSIVCTSVAARDYFRRAFAAAAAALRGLGLADAGYGGRLDVIPLGVRTADFPPRDRAEAQAALGLLPGPVTLLFVGRLSPYSKADLAPLLGALHLLGPRPVRLVLAGAETAGYATALVDLARALGVGDRVHVLRDFETALKPTILAAADVFVSPADSLQETFGLAVVEAMAAGLPVVASDFSGYRDLVVEGETGFLVPTLAPARLDAAWPLVGDGRFGLAVSQRTAVDVGVLTARLATLVDDADLRRRLGAAGRKRALEHFDWAVIVRRLEDLWLELARAAREAPPRPQPVDVLGAGVAQLFGGFPTRLLAPGDRIAEGPLAAQHAASTWAQDPHPDVDLDVRQIPAIIDFVRQHGGAASVAELTDALGRVEDPILWGMKFGLLMYCMKNS